MTVLDWFRKPSEVAYNSKYEPTTTLTDSGYSKEFPVSYYYYGFLLNSSSLYTIQVIILKNDGYEIGPLTMEPITKLSMKGIDIKQIVVLQPNAINSGVTSGATFRYDFIGTTQPPLPGNESIDIAPYHKSVKAISIQLISTLSPVPIGSNIYTVPSGYKLIIHSVNITVSTSSTTGTRRYFLNVIVPNQGGIYSIPTAILADTGSQTAVSTDIIAQGAPASEDLSLTDVNIIKWGSDQIIGENNQIGIYAQPGVSPIVGDTMTYYFIDAELVQI